MSLVCSNLSKKVIDLLRISFNVVINAQYMLVQQCALMHVFLKQPACMLNWSICAKTIMLFNIMGKLLIITLIWIEICDMPCITLFIVCQNII